MLKTILALLCLTGLAPAYGEVSSPRLKAALTYKLLNHVTWVGDPGIKQLDIAYWGPQDAYYTELKNGLPGNTIRGKSLTVTLVNPSSFNPEEFEALIIATGFCAEAAPLINRIRRSNTLVITDTCPFKNDFMINIFVSATNKLAFEVNRTNIVFEGLGLDKNVYLLGGTELDVAELFRDSEYQLQKIRETLDRKIKELAAMEEKLKEQGNILQHHSAEIATQQKAIRDQDSEFMIKLEENIQLVDQIEKNNTILESQKRELTSKNQLIGKQNIVLLVGGIILIIFLMMLVLISKISKQRNHIIEELKQVKNALEISREEEKRANEQKSAFLAKMSHEIRTPMSGVLGMSELLSYTSLSEEQRVLNRSIREAGKVLLSVINDILDFSKLEAGRVVLQSVPFNLETLLMDVSNIFYATRSEKDVSFVVDLKPDLPKIMMGDPLRLEQILINLIGNAFKFTEKGQVMVVVSKKSTAMTNHIRFSIIDTGIGISDLNKKRLFNAFVQADNTITRGYGGTGLGLVICKQLVEQMGGDIGCESSLGQGSTFWIELPLPEASTQVAHQILLPDVDAEQDKKDQLLFFAYPIRTLVAEDNELLQAVMKGVFKQLGLQADFVSDGERVLKTVTANYGNHALVLMDCEMPLMDGMEATREIRQWELRRKVEADQAIKIVALTAHVLPEYMERCKAAGMNDFLIKPIDANLLQATLLAVIKDCLAQPDVLDTSVIRHYYENNDVHFREALSIFQSTITPELTELMELTENLSMDNLKKIAMLTHKHKSSAYMIGAKKLGHILQAINKLAKSNSEEGVKLFRVYLKKSVQETLRQVQESFG